MVVAGKFAWSTTRPKIVRNVFFLMKKLQKQEIFINFAY